MQLTEPARVRAIDRQPLPAPRGIVTPEAVILEFETASVGSRVLAQVVDLGARFTIFSIVTTVFGAALGPVGTTGAVIVFTISGFLLLFGYPAILETMWNGQTVGKRAIGLRVVTVEGAPVTFRHAAIRSMLGLVDFLLPPVGVAATLSVLLTRRDQRLGDVFAGTIVLRERTGAAFPVPVSFPPLPGFESYARTLDVGAVTPEQYALIRSFLIRVDSLLPHARAGIAVGLANPIAMAMHHTPPQNVTPEVFLVSVAAAYQLRLGGPPVPLPPWVHQWR